jgi:hypothetical protein
LQFGILPLRMFANSNLRSHTLARRRAEKKARPDARGTTALGWGRVREDWTRATGFADLPVAAPGGSRAAAASHDSQWQHAAVRDPAGGGETPPRGERGEQSDGIGICVTLVRSAAARTKTSLSSSYGSPLSLPVRLGPTLIPTIARFPAVHRDITVPHVAHTNSRAHSNLHAVHRRHRSISASYRSFGRYLCTARRAGHEHAATTKGPAGGAYGQRTRDCRIWLLAGAR